MVHDRWRHAQGPAPQFKHSRYSAGFIFGHSGFGQNRPFSTRPTTRFEQVQVIRRSTTLTAMLVL